MPESPRLRWWQEEETIPAPPAAVAPRVAAAPVAVAVLPASNIEAELEAEARRRTGQFSRGERAEFVFDRVRSGARLRRLYGWIAAGLAVYLGVFAWMTKDPTFFGGMALFLAEAVLVYLWIMRRWRRQEEPVVTLTDEGITVRTPLQDPGILYWHEVGEIRTTLSSSFAIRPRDMKALCQRLGPKRARRLRIYRLLHRHPIWVPAWALPIPPSEMVKRIEEFRARRGV